MNYQAEYDEYWAADDRIGESSANLDLISEKIVMICGNGRTLDVGSGEGLLVRSLLRRGVDAYGLDVSEVVTARCNSRLPSRFTQGSVLKLPFETASFQTVVSTNCMEHLTPEDVPNALKELHRVSSRYAFLQLATTQDRDEHWHLTVEGRTWWETKCFEAGFRKHPAYYRLNSFESLNNDGWQILIPLEKIPSNALCSYPLSTLKQERDLHMDMLRESGSRSDAHIGRYHLAANYVRPGDKVLDAACGLGYGTHVIYTITKASSLLGIDGSEFAINYASANFEGASLNFTQGLLPDCLECLPDNSIDHILCFETLEHVDHPLRLLEEFHRLLTPGGRITCSVPHEWSDESGSDPNPFHLHVYNKERFTNELSKFFDIEHIFGQTADQVKQPGEGCVWLKRLRSLTILNDDEEETEAEWLLAVAAKSPITDTPVAYAEQVFSHDEVRAAGHALELARDYENPWIIRSLVSIGMRTENSNLRKQWAMLINERHSSNSPDKGAALCVLAYDALQRCYDEPLHWLSSAIDKYINETSYDINPASLRWRISLMFVRSLLALSNAKFDEAIYFLKCTISSQAEVFSPTLLTKPSEAAAHLGLLLASQGKQGESHKILWSSFTQISLALGQRLSKGYETRPPVFEIREMASALFSCGNLVALVANLAELESRPTVFFDETNISMHSSKEWLETQLKLSENERLQLQAGKDWLESQWRASEAGRMRLHEGVRELQIGKDWLENEWRSSEAERLRLLDELSRVRAGKAWPILQNKLSNASLASLHLRRLHLKLNSLFARIKHSVFGKF